MYILKAQVLQLSKFRDYFNSIDQLSWRWLFFGSLLPLYLLFSDYLLTPYWLYIGSELALYWLFIGSSLALYCFFICPLLTPYCLFSGSILALYWLFLLPWKKHVFSACEESRCQIKLWLTPPCNLFGSLPFTSRSH